MLLIKKERQIWEITVLSKKGKKEGSGDQLHAAVRQNGSLCTSRIFKKVTFSQNFTYHTAEPPAASLNYIDGFILPILTKEIERNESFQKWPNRPQSLFTAYDEVRRSDRIQASTILKTGWEDKKVGSL